jgi:hypothetical protein
MDLGAIVRTYIRKIRPKAQAELDWFRGQPSLHAAVEKAALAINSKGKRYTHQRRLQKVSLQHAYRVLEANLRPIARAADFDDLHGLINRILEPVPGIGELYVYDTSLRIGAQLNLLPTQVYLHAGTRAGARTLGLDTSGPTIKPSSLPRELRTLPPHEIEDILCIFKDKFRAKPTTEHIVARSWCG